MLKGVGAAPGISIGTAYLWTAAPARAPISATLPPEEEWSRLETALAESRCQLHEAALSVTESLGVREARLFKTQLALLDDPLLLGTIREGIQAQGLPAEEAVGQAVSAVLLKFESLKDAYLRQRTGDVRDVGERIRKNLSGEARSFASIGSGTIVCAARLTLSEIGFLDSKKVVGLVLQEDGKASHAMILARALKIPAVVGVKEILSKVQTGDPLILDGNTGQVIVRPDRSALSSYRRRTARCAESPASNASKDPAVTRDGFHVEVAANISNPQEVGEARSAGADGIGLFRTEFLFLGRDSLPSEEEQLAVYRKVLSEFAPVRVVIRIADLGGDKELPHLKLAPEPNPALGLRGIRLWLRNSDLSGAQLRALLRAARFGNLAVLLPLVTDLAEVREFKNALGRVRRELLERGEDIRESIPVGVMIETPAAALLARDLVQEADFLSLGTNDLVQYTLAADRLNSQVADLYQPFHPSVLRLLQTAAASAARAGRRVGVCGEMAADLLAVPLLVGMGIQELSLDPRSIDRVKQTIRQLRKSEGSELVEEVLAFQSSNQIIERLQRFIAQKGNVFQSHENS